MDRDKAVKDAVTSYGRPEATLARAALLGD
jgi:hypothetical protein